VNYYNIVLIIVKKLITATRMRDRENCGQCTKLVFTLIIYINYITEVLVSFLMLNVLKCRVAATQLSLNEMCDDDEA